MKFLCVKCDEGMKMKGISGPDDTGSLAVVYHCDQCSYEVAMLTNAHETQLVSSLGVRIGPDGTKTEGKSKCPFTGMLQQNSQTKAEDTAEETQDSFPWTVQAKLRLEKIPEFIRPMAKLGIESFARDKGYKTVDEKVLEEAKSITVF